MQKMMLPFAFCVLSCGLAVGCAKARAQTVPEGPPLATPAPPSRVFSPIEEEEPLAASPVPGAESPTTPPARVNTGNRAPARDRPTPAEAGRTEQPAAATPPPAPAEAPRELQAASSPADAESAAKIGDLMRRASQALNNVYYQGLSSGRKEQYDQAKEFLREADQKVKERNFLYAETLADKAVKLATELAALRN